MNSLINNLPLELQNLICMYVKSDTAKLIKDYTEIIVEERGSVVNNSIVWMVQENKDLGFKTFKEDRYECVQNGCFGCSCQLIKKDMNYPVEGYVYCYYCADCYGNVFGMNESTYSTSEEEDEEEDE